MTGFNILPHHLIALLALSFTSTEGFGSPNRLYGRVETTSRARTIFFLSSAAASGDSFSRANGRVESSASIKDLYDLADKVNENLNPNEPMQNQALDLLSAARSQLKRNKLTFKQKKDLSQKIDDSIQIITASAFAPPYTDPKRILSGMEILNALTSKDYGLCVPYNLIPIKTLLSAITALTAYVKAFSKENPVMTDAERETESRMANEAFRLLQRLVTGSGLRVRDPFVREAEFTRVLDAFCTAGKMDMAQRVVALQARASNAPPPSAITYSVLLRGYGDAGNAEQVTRVFAESQSRGIRADTVMLNSLIDAYINCGEIMKANALFRRMKRGEAEAPANLRTYNTMLKGWAENERLDQVKRLAKGMEKADLWDDVTVNTIVHAAVLERDWSFAEKMLSDHYFQADNLERHPQVEAYTELLNGYSEAGMIDEALYVYLEMDMRKVEPTDVTFCCILRVLGVKGDLAAAYKTLNRMISMGLTPSAKVFGALILGLTDGSTNIYSENDSDHSARISGAIAVLNKMIDARCFPPPTLIAVVLGFMSKSREPKIEEALGFVETMTERDVIQRGDVVVWTALMKYYSSVGYPAAALKTFQAIQNPDVAAWNELLNICVKSSNSDRVMKVFHQNFKPRGILTPDIITYTLALTSLLSGNYNGKNFLEARKLYNDLKASPTVFIDNVFVDVVLKLVLRQEVIDFVGRSDVYFLAAILNEAETLSWDPGQLERRKRVARGMLGRRLQILFGDANFLDTLLLPDSDVLFERKGWNQVESGFQVLGWSSKDDTEDRFLEDNGWNSVDSGFSPLVYPTIVKVGLIAGLALLLSSHVDDCCVRSWFVDTTAQRRRSRSSSFITTDAQTPPHPKNDRIMVETSASDILKHNSAIREHDVLLGRGGATNNHKGNQHFRTIVAEHQREYLKSRKKEKIGIARRVVALIQSNGGRFLKRTPADEWVEVDDKRAQEKTSQALREGLDVRNKVVRTGNKSAIRRAQKKFGNIIPPNVVKGNVIVTSQSSITIKNSLCHEHRFDAHVIVPDGAASPQQQEEEEATTQPVFVLYQPQTPLVAGTLHAQQKQV